MATYDLPNLRHTQQSGAGTITVPANKTWVIKTATARVNHTLGPTSEGVTVTATINSNAAVVYDVLIQNRTGGALGAYNVGQPIFSSTIILKAGDTLALAVVGSPSVATLDVYYYILEDDF
jgi:hypothetical protein